MNSKYFAIKDTPAWDRDAGASPLLYRVIVDDGLHYDLRARAIVKRQIAFPVWSTYVVYPQ